MRKRNIEKELSFTLSEIENDKEYLEYVADLLNSEIVKSMDKYIQHGTTTTLEHCINVSYISYKLAKKFHLDAKSTARAGLLHDLFLYDWRMKYRDPKNYGLHGFVHPKIALRNALEQFELNVKEQDIIVKHMWPMTVVLPKYKESYIVTLTDKYSAIREIYTYYLSKLRNRKIYKYAYAFFSLMLAVRIV